ncbi:hypothetical protein LMH87_006868 [Akanthomyces muscarius]|uniref:Uncharacterized protein n=1 Tax=Akanthomyces muscarius TaxID=2231603 RepID=A0A9W8QS01_AKAMU|nr:hypothetical protein LMH87_006868 [Akanthomyces muscarius]KAJ4165227.1 hypothetical protein LMH87_006868 [Akanthomyces muscarius]
MEPLFNLNFDSIIAAIEENGKRLARQDPLAPLAASQDVTSEDTGGAHEGTSQSGSNAVADEVISIIRPELDDFAKLIQDEAQASERRYDVMQASIENLLSKTVLWQELLQEQMKELVGTVKSLKEEVTELQEKAKEPSQK